MKNKAEECKILQSKGPSTPDAHTNPVSKPIRINRIGFALIRIGASTPLIYTQRKEPII